jgi:hypothetical protein
MKNPSAKVLGGGLVLALALLLPSLTGESAPLPPPKKMTLPPTADQHLKMIESLTDKFITRFKNSTDEAVLIPNVRYTYYTELINCFQMHLNGGPRWKMDRPLTTEERRALRVWLYRLQRELKEGQANGTVGHEEFQDAWQRLRNNKTKK